MIYIITDYSLINSIITVTINAYNSFATMHIDGNTFNDFSNETPIDSITFDIAMDSDIIDSPQIHSHISKSDEYLENYRIIYERNTN
jgi:hypothetical protein